MKIRKAAVGLMTFGTIAVMAACSGHGGTQAPFDGPYDMPQPPPDKGGGDVAPTPTPSGPVYLEKFHTPSGLAQMPLGKCLGFTVVANGVTFPSTGMSVNLGPMGSVPFTWMDPTHLRVGAPETEGTCVYTPFWGLDPGLWDVTVKTADTEWDLPAAIEVDAPEMFHVTDVRDSRVYSSDKLSGVLGANTFDQPYDVDIYKVDFIDPTPWARVYPHLDYFDKGTGIVPSIQFWNDKDALAPENEGAFADIFPMNGTNYLVVRDVSGQGGPGKNYDLGMERDQLKWTADASGCANAQPIAPGSYHIDDAHLTNAFDPQGNGYCLDSVFGDPIVAPGPDAVFTITVPAGKELRAESYDNHWSQAIYLLPRASGCDPMPMDCTAAAGHFGGGNINTVRYMNDTGADQDFYLVFDTTAISTTSDGAFLVSVELNDPR
jgi:hypothetical protein